MVKATTGTKVWWRTSRDGSVQVLGWSQSLGLRSKEGAWSGFDFGDGPNGWVRRWGRRSVLDEDAVGIGGAGVIAAGSSVFSEFEAMVLEMFSSLDAVFGQGGADGRMGVLERFGNERAIAMDIDVGCECYELHDAHS